MRIPCVSDYYVGGIEELLDVPTRLCVLCSNPTSSNYKNVVTIREIYHFR